MKLEYPLNDALPNIQHARDRLLARIFHYRLENEVSLHTTDSDYALLYAYGMSLHVFSVNRASVLTVDSSSSVGYWSVGKRNHCARWRDQSAVWCIKRGCHRAAVEHIVISSLGYR
jgi:hypothetical protein